MLGAAEEHGFFDNVSLQIRRQASSVKRRFGYGGDRSAGEELRLQLGSCVEILGVLRRSVLLLDEVDLVLHPLKSELNWPLGDKVALDFTEETELHDRPGMRWRLPFFLLDALFFASSGVISVVDLSDNPAAGPILKQIKSVVTTGLVEQLLQAAPHLLLLSKEFYQTKLQPLLASWLVIFIRQQKLRQLSDAQILAYLLHRTEPEDGAMRRVGDEHLKLLNLATDWLCIFLPHVLGRTSRVNFGLLQPNDLERALAENPLMPRNRKLLAVPFVGKDVPSKASEFSHPDIVIGLTILAYRYEGLRPTDVRTVLRGLRGQMAQEAGPYSKRPACVTFASWIDRAGKRVRGTARNRDAEAKLLEAAVRIQQCALRPVPLTLSFKHFADQRPT